MVVQTLGSIDESMRHSISKMSNFHFVSIHFIEKG